MKMDGAIKVLKKMAENDELKDRVDGVFNCRDASRDADMERAISEKGAFNVSDIFKIDTVKYFIDEDISMMELYDAAFNEANGDPKHA